MVLLGIIGRILFGGYFLMSGIRHFMNADMLSGYAASKGVPAPRAAVYGSGALLVIGGLGVLSGMYVAWAVAALALFFVPVSFMMHAFWSVEPSQRMGESVNFLKNMALLGAALMLLAIPEPWAYALSYFLQ
ncbi:MAG: DoxX family protein [Candidatus Liptonbacteria bacterium]|nr:DoxX family protein [Candidatus Liptonbacteria bacterium]